MCYNFFSEMGPDRLIYSERERISVEKGMILEPHGMCGGVVAAVKFAEDLLRKVDGREKVYTFNEVVHNHAINSRLEDMGLEVIRERTPEGDWPYDLIPNGSVYLLPAHGHTPRDIEIAESKGLEYFRAVCVLVENEWQEVRQEVSTGRKVLLIGKANHPEPRGTMGQVPAESIIFITSVDDLVAYVESSEFDPEAEYAMANQTTISLRDIHKIRQTAIDLIPKLDVHDKRGGCYATDNRQKAAEHFFANDGGDALIVVGSGDISNNTFNLAKVAWDRNIPGWLVNNAEELDWSWFCEGSGLKTVGLTSGASVQEDDLLGVVEALRSRGVAIEYQKPVVIERKTEFPIRDYSRISQLDQRYSSRPTP